MIMVLIYEAVQSGSRLKTAAACIGLSARTIIRWRRQNAGQDQRKGPYAVPANKLCEAECGLFNYIKIYYNRRRRHSANGYKSSAVFEKELKKLAKAA